MPCDTVTTTTVSENADRLNAARFMEANARLPVRIVGNEIRATARTEELAREIIAQARRNYAAATIREASRRFGFRITAETTTDAGHLQLQLRR